MSNVNRVTDALPTFASGEWSTVGQIATQLNMGYSTASRYLRDAVAEGKAEVGDATTAQGRGKVYRQAANTRNRPGARKAQGVRPADAPTVPGPDAMVWVATSRAGSEYHSLASTTVTTCDRETGGRYGRFYTPGGPWATATDAAEKVNRHRPCGKCFPQRADQADESAEIVAQRVAARERTDPGPVADTVWAATRRVRLAFHELSARFPGRTLCGRSTLSTTSWTGERDAATSAGMVPCDRCVSAAQEAALAGPAPQPAESAVDASEPVTLPDTRTPARSAGSAPVGSVEEWMSSQRPVPDAPAEEPRPRRTRQPRPARGDVQPKAAFAKGQLRDAVLDVLAAHAGHGGGPMTVADIAKTLNSYPGPVATNLARMQVAGRVVLTSAEGEKRRYALATAG